MKYIDRCCIIPKLNVIFDKQSWSFKLPDAYWTTFTVSTVQWDDSIISWKYKEPRILFVFFLFNRRHLSFFHSTILIEIKWWKKKLRWTVEYIWFLCNPGSLSLQSSPKQQACCSENNYVFFVQVKKRAQSPITVYIHRVSK